MRRILSTLALATVLSFGSGNAFALETGVPEVDELIEALEADILASCAGASKDATSCAALLQVFAGLVTPAGFAALPGYTTLIAANPAVAAAVEVAVASPAFETSFATTQVALGSEIATANAADPVFAQTIAPALTQATGVNTAGGEDDEPASPTTP